LPSKEITCWIIKRPYIVLEETSSVESPAV